MDGTPFADRYRETLSVLGQPAESPHAWDRPLPESLPQALAELYAVAAKHPFNRVDYELRMPDDLEVIDGKVVFAEENQGVVVWAYNTSDDGADPVVWQGQPSRTEPGGIETWYSEEKTLSVFVVELWNWLFAE